MHLKNFSLLEVNEGSREYILSPAYDMLSTNAVIPSDNEELALSLNGKKRNITRNDFISFAESIDIPVKAAEKMIEKIVKLKDRYIEMCRESYLPVAMKTSLEELICQRTQKLNK